MPRPAIRIINGRLTCKNCGQTKPVAEFNKRQRAINGYTSLCKLCACEYRRTWWWVTLTPEEREQRNLESKEQHRILRRQRGIKERKSMSTNEMVRLTDRLTELHQNLEFDQSEHDRLNREMQAQVSDMFEAAKEFNEVINKIKELASQRAWIIDTVNKIAEKYDCKE